MATLYSSGNLSALLDTFIRSSSAGTSYGSNSYVVCGQRPSWSQDDVGLFKFAMPITDPDGGVIIPISANLTLTTYTTTDSESGILKAGRMSAAFSEDSTWNSVASYRISAVESRAYTRGSTGDQDTISILETYKAIVNAGVNYGFWLGDDNAGAWRVCSSEYGTSGYRPKLACTYNIRRYYTASHSNYCSCSLTGSCLDGDSMSFSCSLTAISGYTTVFDGWYFNGSLYTYTQNFSLTAGTSIAGTWVAYAHIVQNVYTCYFDKDGGSGGDSAIQDYYDGNLGHVTPPLKTGYTFTGYYIGGTQFWNANGDGVRTWNFPYDNTAIAGWTINYYNVYACARDYISAVFINFGTVSSDSPHSYAYGSGMTFGCNVAQVTGYTTTFHSWRNGSGTIVSYSQSDFLFTLGAGDVAYYSYATRTANTYTIAYNGNGNTGGSTASSSHTYDSAKNLTANGFTKTGYTFAGWATSAGGTVVYSNSQSISNLTSTNGATITLYAVWTANSYTATFNVGSGTIIGNSTKTVTYNAVIGTLPSATRTGYDFAGWWTGAGGTGTQISSVTLYVNASNTTYYAKWTGSGRLWSNIGTKKYKGSVNFTWNGTGWTSPS